MAFQWLDVRYLRGLPEFRILTVNDNCCSENLCLVADTRILGAKAARELDALVRIHGKPVCVVSDNGTEFISRAILKWANDNKVAWPYIDPRKPQQNASSSRSTEACAPLAHVNMHCRATDECPNEEIFDTLADARRTLALWRYDYNNVRPHPKPMTIKPKGSRYD